MHLNHSCEPNLGLQGQVVYVALRDIGVGEELTADYAMTDDEPYEITCRCGRPSCPGTITGFNWCKPEIQAKYAGYFSWFIQAASTSSASRRRRTKGAALIDDATGARSTKGQ